ncbi:MAG TPA: class I SAM-dependent rRNA methyltransferase [Phycisphaerae bacterium]|jgi:23S rRNA (cytosine1962-C5)-methyltransferase
MASDPHGRRPATPPEHLLPESPHPWVRLRSVSFHPFVYDRMLATVDPKAVPGDVVAVYDKQGEIFGHGLFNPRSRIALRMLSYGPVPVDETFWRRRLAAAVALRRQTLRLDESTDAYRLVHAEGDGLSGLIAERYADTLVFELFSLGMYQRVELLARLLTESLGAPDPQRPEIPWRIVVRADERVEQIEGFRVSAPAGAPGPQARGSSVTIRENDVRFRVDARSGHKTGFFCDQRENRRALAALCHDADVLDLCCYTGGFGLYARVLGGARDVTAVDLDEEALALARDNANLNQVRIRQVHADVYPYLRQMIANQRTYDVVVLDPPKLIATRDELTEGRQRYLDMNKLAMQVVRPGGVLLTCSCSGLLGREAFLDVIRQAARITERRAVVFNISGAAGDHPLALNCPETSYLKAVWLRVT